MSRIRPVWIIGAAVAVAVLVVIAVAWLVARPGSACGVVRDMLAYNETHNAQLARADGDAAAELSENDYVAWATRLNEYAGDVSDRELEPHARRLAEIADATVSVVRKARDDSVPSATTSAPAWVSDYARLNREFEAETAILAELCPA